MKLIFFFVLGILILFSPSAQENSLDWDIDAIFDEPFPVDETTVDDAASSSVLDSMMRRGITFDASFEFLACIAPGLLEAPWLSKSEFTWAPGAKMIADFGLDAQISAVFRVKSTFHFEIPSFDFSMKEFFFDYNLYDAVFFRGGKYNLSWGISPNYRFTDLLFRVPNDEYAGDSYLLKADVPVGIGGFQVLVLTRMDLMGGAGIGWQDFGYGGKYNLALTWADFNSGLYYKDGMPLRSFLSIKTTLRNTELYSEGLFAINVEKPDDYSGAANLGFARDFFGNKLSVNGELFYNDEENTSWFRPRTSIRKEEKALFVEGFNIALNLLYRFGGWGSPRLFIQTRYAPLENSALLVPGFRLSPLSHVEVYLAVPMALGSKDGRYYKDTEDPHDRPFSVMLLVTLKGNVQTGYYY